MTYREDFTLPAELLEQVSTQGFDVLPELIRIVVNAAMQAERQQHLKAAPYQRTPERESYANGDWERLSFESEQLLAHINKNRN